MGSGPRALLARLIPNALNRTTWLLAVGMTYLIVLTGPLLSALSFWSLYKTPVLSTLGWLLTLNLIVTTIGAVAGTLVLSRVQSTLSGPKFVGFYATLLLVGFLARLIVLRILPFESVPPAGAMFALGNGLRWLLMVAIVAAAMLYSSSRERTLNESLSDFTHTSIALANEEAAVRGEVFDQLHGTVQSELAAIRRQLAELATTCPDSHAAAIARRIDHDLDVLYRESIGAVAKALNPPGLEASLLVALAEFQSRLAPAVKVDIQVDPIIVAMDNPMTGGLRHNFRLGAYRIIEEAVSNAIQHSSAYEVAVTLSSRLVDSTPMLRIRISHSHAGAGPILEGSGLARMRSRARALGGFVKIQHADGKFQVSARLPLAGPAGTAHAKFSAVDVEKQSTM